MDLNSRATPPDIYDYHVGWICRSERDFGATCKILDEVYRAPKGPSIPSAKYRFGRIGDQNIVINIPLDDSGGDTPVDLAKTLMEHFRAVRFLLVVGSDGVANTASSQGSICLGDVVIGTHVISCDSQGNEKEFGSDERPLGPPDYLRSAVTVLSRQRLPRGAGLQQLIDIVTAGDRNITSLYQRPRDFPTNSTTGRMTPQQASLSYRRELSNQNTQSDRPVKVIYGDIASGPRDKRFKTSQVTKRMNLAESTLCFVTEIADILEAGISCLPILGISSDAHGGDAVNTDWLEYSSLAAAVCSKEILASIDPDAILKARSNLTAKDADIIAKKMKGIGLSIKAACRTGQSEQITQARERTEQYLEELESLIISMSSPQADQKLLKQELVVRQNEIQDVQATQRNMGEDIRSMQEQIAGFMETSLNHDAQFQEELEKLQATVTDHASRLDALSDFTDGALKLTTEFMVHASNHTDNAVFLSVTDWLSFTSSYDGLLKKFGNVFTRQNKSSARPQFATKLSHSKRHLQSNDNTPGASRASQSRSESPNKGHAADKPRKNTSTLDKLKPHLNWLKPSRPASPSVSEGSSKVDFSDAKSQPDQEPPPLPHRAPLPSIQNTDMVQPGSSSQYTRQSTAYSDHHGSNTRETSLDSRQSYYTARSRSVMGQSPSGVDPSSGIRNNATKRAGSATPRSPRGRAPGYPTNNSEAETENLGLVASRKKLLENKITMGNSSTRY